MKPKDPDLKNGRVSARSISRVTDDGIVNQWMPTLCGYGFSDGDGVVLFDSRDDAIAYAKKRRKEAR